ncbi:MAG: phosphoribosylanthranilate isomerase [Clostridiaceae bacterium]|nr:phosphoribosylanthranilate isomerase [Clostridiaceae bacterium]
MVKIKICGLTSEQDIESVNKALPDYIGFVFAKSRRQVDENRAKELKKRLSPHIKAVGVFVNEEPERIINLCRNKIIDLVQLHGVEDEDYIRHLRCHIPNKIIRAVRVKEPADIEKAADFSCDYLLLDAFDEKEYGGTGKTFDWSMISAVNRPFFLAGGINSGNAVRAIKHCRPYCIDVSSGVETGGCKDRDKIKEIVAIVRQFTTEDIKDT